LGDGLALSHVITDLYEMGAHRERSKCPIAYSLDIVGDRWTLLVLRDLAFKDRRYFRDFLGASEAISSNILTERLRRLQRWNLITMVPDPSDGRRSRYFLTNDGLDLLPILIEMTVWGSKRQPESNPPPERIERMSPDRAGTIRKLRERHIAERTDALDESVLSKR
jgi:DNA-binding HxlR family transcriptional regulator